MDAEKMDEKTPLLGGEKENSQNGGITDNLNSGRLPLSPEAQETLVMNNENIPIKEKVKLKRTISLFSAVVFIIVNMMGTGIFVVPSGIMQGVGSIGTSLLIWIICGLYSLVLALCYAELGTAFPVAGGDYTYVQKTLGSLPGFMCLFTYVLLAPVATAVMARTVGEYLMPLAGLECQYYITVMLAIFLTSCSAILNMVTVKWTMRILNLLMVVKGLSFGLIIILGLIQLGRGNTANFDDVFAGSITTPSSIATAIIPAYTSLAGWDLICSLAEEMKNPQRDIPLGLVIAVLLTVGIYVLMNVAFFTVLSPLEVSRTNAVAGAFAAKLIPGYNWIIPVMVALSAIGTLIAVFLGLPRFLYAGAKDKQLPDIFSHLSVHYFTPLPAIALQFFLSIFFCAATVFDIQALFLLLGVNLLIKMMLTLMALVYLKIKLNHLPRGVKVPLPVVIVCLLIMIGIIIMSIIQDPFINGFGLLLFCISLPIYFLAKLVRKSKTAVGAIDKITHMLQCLLMVIPAEKEDIADIKAE